MTYRLTIRNRHIDTILNEITTKIPDSETSIDLSTPYEMEGNDFFFLNTITAENYIKILREFPKLIKSVDMSQNELSRFNGDLVAVTQALPENLSSLTWHNNDLAKLPADVLVNVFKALPRKLTSLDLGENDLDTMPADDFARAMQALPEGLETLNLTANLRRYSADEIVTIFKSLPPGLKSLNLSLCNFYRFTVDEWIKIMGALPKNLRELGLIFNMVAVNPADWPGIMNSMPQNLRSIDLRHNGFDKLPADDQATIFKQASDNLSKIYIDALDTPVDPMIFVVDNEINRLMNTHSSKNSFLVNIGVIEVSDAKINALSRLKDIIADRANSGVLFNDELAVWYADNKDCLKIQRNKLHSFFQPDHKACTQTVVEEVLAHFGIDTKAMSSVQHFNL